MKTKWKRYWCVITSNGAVFLSSARATKRASITAYLADVDLSDGTNHRNWRWWRRNGVNCQQVEISVRDAY